jgi:hypothetical protein
MLREMFGKEGAGSFELTHLLRLSEALAHLAKGGGTSRCWNLDCRTVTDWICCGGLTRGPPVFR